MKRFISMLILISLLALYSFSYSDNIEQTSDESVSGVSDVKDSLSDLSNEEKKILEELFLIVQQIKEMEELEYLTALEIDDIRKEILDMENNIQIMQEEYDENLYIMEDVLKIYQRNGATTYLELILSSDNLNTLLRRINAIRDISRNTSTLLEDLEETKEKLIKDKEKLNNTLDKLENRQNELQRTIEKSITLRNELEASLSALHEDKVKFEEYLYNLENRWVEIKPIFSETINMLVEIIEKGDLPEGTIRINLSATGVRGSIKENYIKEVLESRTFPTKVELLFYEGKIELVMPEIEVYMSGNLELLEDKQSLIFRMEEGAFQGMKLELSAMEELFTFGYLQFNFQKLLDKSTIREIIIKDDYLELLINPVLF
ncbi:hypothetical protein [Tissierella sp. Yu-01]|uniref:coiled-coil domain-containing protein n=1 Tax=Tissierella sp. Yu-01 TaxID=3035694 RepID=UPI00240DE0EB|nr:hypothetical protein [Tissierella sp. Yu-01]WFA10143.1 hypothetical protein P3962_06220 [Tissierella sp. Yu-01]